MTILALTALPVRAEGPVPPVQAAETLKTGRSWNGATFSYPQGEAQVSVLTISLAPGSQTGWHRHPVPSVATVVQGTLEVSLRDGTTRQFKPGESFAEVVDTPHNGRAIGAEAVKLVVVYTGVAGGPLTVRDEH